MNNFFAELKIRTIGNKIAKRIIVTRWNHSGKLIGSAITSTNCRITQLTTT